MTSIRWDGVALWTLAREGSLSVDTSTIGTDAYHGHTLIDICVERKENGGNWESSYGHLVEGPKTDVGHLYVLPHPEEKSGAPSNELQRCFICTDTNKIIILKNILVR